jgi:catechol 2,3-dioxygenase-like lactoylglutathione lyase family enzyme
MTRIHHVAIPVDDVPAATSWYCREFDCRISYQDPTWAMLEFDNLSLALVTRGEHPPHIALTHPRADRFGRLVTHRDGTRSVYIRDASGNAVEILEAGAAAPPSA